MAPAGLAVAVAVANQGKTVLAVMVAVKSCWFCWTVSKLSILFFSLYVSHTSYSAEIVSTTGEFFAPFYRTTTTRWEFSCHRCAVRSNIHGQVGSPYSVCSKLTGKTRVEMLQWGRNIVLN